MKTKIKIEQEVDITTLLIVAAVNYDEEEIPNDFPGREGETWTAQINIDTGKIEGWPNGRECKMHLTVKDEGVYRLFNDGGGEVACIDNNYVPHCLIPGDYGDVIRLDISSDGTIKNWPKNPTFGDFFDEED